jgi:hypothetical protein
MKRCVWFCGCHHHTARGVAGTVVALCGCCGCWHCAVWVLQLSVSCRMGVAAVGVTPRGCCGCQHCAVLVLQLLSSHRAWCCRHCHCAAHGGVVTVVAPRVVSRSWQSCRVVLWSWRVSLRLLSSPSLHHHCGRWLGCGRPWRERTAAHLLAKMKLAGKRKTENCTSRVSWREEHSNVARVATRAWRPGKV